MNNKRRTGWRYDGRAQRGAAAIVVGQRFAKQTLGYVAEIAPAAEIQHGTERTSDIGPRSFRRTGTVVATAAAATDVHANVDGSSHLLRHRTGPTLSNRL